MTCFDILKGPSNIDAIYVSISRFRNYFIEFEVMIHVIKKLSVKNLLKLLRSVFDVRYMY